MIMYKITYALTFVLFCLVVVDMLCMTGSYTVLLAWLDYKDDWNILCCEIEMLNYFFVKCACLGCVGGDKLCEWLNIDFNIMLIAMNETLCEWTW